MVRIDIETQIRNLETQEQSEENRISLLETYLSLIHIITDQDFIYTKSICQKGITLSKQINHTKYNAHFESELGKCALRLGDYTGANKRFKKAQLLFKKAGAIEEEIGTLQNRSTTYLENSEFEEGIQILYKAAKLANEHVDQVKPKLITIIYINLGNSHNELGLFDKALEYYSKALKLSSENASLYFKGKILYYIGQNYIKLKDFNLATKHLNESLEILKSLDKESEIFYIHIAFSLLNSDFKKPESGLRHVLKAFDLAKKLQSPKFIDISILRITNILLSNIHNEEDFHSLNTVFSLYEILNEVETLALSYENPTLLLNTYELKSNYYKCKQQWKKAFEYKEKTNKALKLKYEEENKRELKKEKAINQVQQKDKELQHQIKLLDKEKKANKKLQYINKSIQEQNQLMILKSEELQEVLRELENFAFITSHDLKEPLRAIKSFLQLIKIKYKDVLDDQGLSYIDFSLEGANRIKKLIEDLLLYTKLTNQDHSFKECDLNKVLLEVTNEVNASIEEEQLIIDKPKPLPSIIANKKMMQLLFHHLISNAIKYKNESIPKIEITHTTQEEYIRIAFKDNGIGIDKEFQAKIFDIFRRLHNNDTHKGTGIGLTICKKIVSLHKGNIWLDSTIGKGSTFYIELPYEK